MEEQEPEPWPSLRGVPMWAALAVGVLLGLVLIPVIDRATELRGGSGCGGAKGVLTIAAGQDVSAGEQRRILIQRWNEQVRHETGSPPARVEEISAVADDQRSQMIAAASSCRYDVLGLDLPWIQEFYERGHLTALPEFVQGDFLRNAWSAGVRDEKAYAVPFATDVGLLFYRKDLLEKMKVDPPGTWGDIEAIARKNPRAASRRLEAVLGGQFARYEGLTVNLLEQIWSSDGELVKTDGQVSTEPLVTKAVTRLNRWMTGAFPVIWPGSVQSHERETIDAFLAGKILMMRHWPYVFRVLATNEAMRDRVGVTTLPGQSVLGGESLAVSASSGQAQAARNLIDFLTGPSAQKLMFACGGYAPTRAAAYQDPLDCRAAQEAVGIPEAQLSDHDSDSPEESAELGRRLTDFAKTLQTALGKARPRPPRRHYSEFSLTVQCQVHPLLRDRRAPTDVAAGRLVAALNAALAGRGQTGCA